MTPAERTASGGRGDFVAELLARAAGFVPEWRPAPTGPDAAILEVAARYLGTIAHRLDQAPDKGFAAFAGLLGLALTPPRPARTVVCFQLAERSPAVRLPAGTRVAAPPPPGRDGQISFETEHTAGVGAARLTDVVALWPGRDQYAVLTGAAPMRPFDRSGLGDTPHVLYLAHDRLLALRGDAEIVVSLELTTPGSDPLGVRWEYWDGTLWREFDGDDGTAGLRHSGSYLLRAGCARTRPVTVGGTEAHWIRGRLDETLPPDPARVLPEVDAVRLSTTVDRAYTSIWTVAAASGPGPGVDVNVRDATGLGLGGVQVTLEEAGSTQPTDAEGLARFAGARPGDTVSVALGATRQAERLTEGTAGLTFTLAMPAADQAVAEAAPVDLTRPFQPLGGQPQPGAALYLSGEDALERPGARLRVYIQPAAVETVTGGDILSHTVSWEYFNGRNWVSMLTAGMDEPGAFDRLGVLDLVVPDDLEPAEVGGVQGRWLRARLTAGAYASRHTVNGVTYLVPRPPILADIRLGHLWQDGPVAAERVLAWNDFTYTDRTEEAAWPGGAFLPYSPVGDPSPALYLGFDGPFPEDRLGIHLEVTEVPDDPRGPALIWEYWNAAGWRRLPAEDETAGLRRPGLVSLAVPADSAPLARFAGPRHWLRARLTQDGPPGDPEILQIRPYAAWAVQRETITGEPLGTADGTPGQALAFRRIPVLSGPAVEVRELAGMRAEVEWRLTAAAVLGAAALPGLDARLGESRGDVAQGPLRLVRDRDGRVREVWVRWDERSDLYGSGPGDRHYLLEPVRGLMVFGDGRHGRMPPPGAAVVAALYRTGGGRAGNVAAGAVTQVLGTAAAIEQVTNPRPATGGTEAETLRALLARAPGTIRAHGRAVTGDDYAVLAAAASPAVARAWPVPGPPGSVTVAVVPYGEPLPSPGLCETVRRHLAAHAPAWVRIAVTGPAYLSVGVTATLVPADPDLAGEVEAAARWAITRFLDPVSGGPGRQGLAPGADLHLSDVAAALAAVPGLEQVTGLAFLPWGDAVPGRPGRVPAAGEIRLEVSGG
ncbi:putative baseplate assembly protein [Sphaerisporangium rhizosphaerae]|uniref:Baseplate assembly protein n=1 Tax=Sphaerisporangium rhizosphaerae TaxID=2269375 RepID=A0ABW2PHG6_9ACTN